MDPSGSTDLRPLARQGDVLAGRYRLEAPLGRGAQGEVWRGTDLAVRGSVAVKLLRSGAEADPARVRREAAALRLVRIPGVVRLLDEGVEHERTFLVLDLVDGSPFPGRATRMAWADLAPIATALFETLARVHAAGIVHRDLKPANVLVTSDGRPVILDFGLSRFATPRGDDLTGADHLIGTPAYLAPEQLLGQTATARTDLYGAGVLLYEALAGRLPHDTADWMTLMRAKLTRAPAPLKDAAPDVPVAVARAVDQLLAPQPADRPSSAAEALRRLLGEQTPPPADLPWLGPRDDIELAVRQLLAGRAVNFIAESGGGRTRFVNEVSNQLKAAGRSPVELAPATRPFVSLEPAVGVPAAPMTMPLAEVVNDVARSVRAFFDRGGVLFADDAESVDTWSLRTLRAPDAKGPVLLVGPSAALLGAQRLRGLEEEDLRALFVGPDRLFHLREDAARLLWQRTSGRPHRVADEVAAWVRAGIARPDGAHYRVDRDSLDALEEGLLMASPPAPDRALEVALPDHLATLATWVGLVGRYATAPFLAGLLAEPRWRVEAEMEDMVRRGVARPAADGALLLEQPADATQMWPVERVRAAHRKIAEALPPGAPHRLVHLNTAGDATPAEIGREALDAARRLVDEGKSGRAVAVLEEGVRGLRTAEGAEVSLLEGLFALWLEIALMEATPKAADRILYDLQRISGSTSMLHRIESLAHAGVALSVDPARALSIGETLPPFENAGLERARWNIIVMAARSASERQEAAALDSAASWAGGTREPEDLAVLEMWRGRYCYRMGRFEEAAAHHLRAADASRVSSSRIAASLNAASALIEAFSPRQAVLIASDAGEAARRSRYVFLEARAEWLLRAATYRLEVDCAADLDLIEAIAALGVAHLEAPVCLTEATFAWRRGQPALARRLALQAERLWAQARIHGELSLLSRVLAIVCGEPATPAELTEIVARAVRCVVSGVGIQILGLARMAGARHDTPASVVSSLLAGIDPAHFGVRMDVISVLEAYPSV